MNILIADDHKLVRMGLCTIIEEEFLNAHIVEAGNAREILRELRKQKFDLMLMDLKMPDTDSFDLLEQVTKHDPAMKVLVVSLNPESIFALRCLKAGACGYIEKSTNDLDIRKAVRKVAAGKKYMSDEVMEMMTDFMRSGKSSDPFETLSKQEFVVAMHLINGLSNSKICEAMNLQASTVGTYKTKIFEKTNVKTVHELMQLASQFNIN